MNRGLPISRDSRGRTALGTIAGSFAYGFAIGLIASIVFDGFDIVANVIQAGVFGVIFVGIHLLFRKMRAGR